VEGLVDDGVGHGGQRGQVRLADGTGQSEAGVGGGVAEECGGWVGWWSRIDRGRRGQAGGEGGGEGPRCWGGRNSRWRGQIAEALREPRAGAEARVSAEHRGEWVGNAARGEDGEKEGVEVPQGVEGRVCGEVL